MQREETVGTAERLTEINATVPMYGFADKGAVQAAAARYWNPDKTEFWQQEGVPLVIGERHGYVLHDLDGHEVIDVHLNGGTYNLGHRNPEVIQQLTDALQYMDVGNHHFPSPGRAALGKALVEASPAGWFERVVFGSGGGEVVDVAIKSARYATGRKKIVSIVKAFHGHTGLAIGTGDARFSRMFHTERPDEFVQVPFNDVSAMAEVLAGDDVAAVIMETIPATYGFPLPDEGYLAEVARLAHAHGALYIADEVQTGLWRTGTLWAIEQDGAQPDILVTGKGLSGGIYPVTACLLNGQASRWLELDGFAHMSTFGGSDLGCAVGLKTLQITLRPQTAENVSLRSEQFRTGLDEIRKEFPELLIGIRQRGLVMGLEFAGAEGAKPVMKGLYENGVWAIFSTLDPHVLQFKPGVLIDEETTDLVLDRLRLTLAGLRAS